MPGIVDTGRADIAPIIFQILPHASSHHFRAFLAACLLALAVVRLDRSHEAPSSLESVSILSGLNAAASQAVAGMQRLWGSGAPTVPTRAAFVGVRVPVRFGTGGARFQNVNTALSTAGQAAMIAQQVLSSLFVHIYTYIYIYIYMLVTHITLHNHKICNP